MLVDLCGLSGIEFVLLAWVVHTEGLAPLLPWSLRASCHSSVWCLNDTQGLSGFFVEHQLGECGSAVQPVQGGSCFSDLHKTMATTSTKPNHGNHQGVGTLRQQPKEEFVCLIHTLKPGARLLEDKTLTRVTHLYCGVNVSSWDEVGNVPTRLC